jgi:hypothetical protein
VENVIEREERCDCESLPVIGEAIRQANPQNTPVDVGQEAASSFADHALATTATKSSSHALAGRISVAADAAENAT